MKYFEVIDGRLKRIRPWPKKLTKKRALQLSIRKWELFVESKDDVLNEGADSTCALCQLYIDKYCCGGCPIAEYVGDANCGSTPYEDRYDNPQLELDFLKEVYLDKYGEEYP